MWLHGSCANITEGLCGTWNKNPGDDLWGGTPNSNGEHFQVLFYHLLLLYYRISIIILPD